MAKVIFRNEILIDTDDYSVVSGNHYVGCKGCPFYKQSTSSVYCYDLFRRVYGKSCLELKAIPKSSAKTITKTTVLVDGEVLSEE